MEQNTVIAMHKNVDFFRNLKINLPENVNVLEKKMEMLLQEIRMKPISCVILYIEHHISDELYIERLRKGFPSIPFIAILVNPSMELARHCGVIGIDSVLPYEDIELIGDEVTRICTLKNNKVRLEDISIDKTNVNYSEMLKEALSIIEQKYVKMLNTNEIADLMEITEATLSREFAKFGLPGPKKVLILMKIEHAIKLMLNKGLNIREISSLSGFTEEKRMAECFHRMFGMPPGEYRAKNIRNLAKQNIN